MNDERRTRFPESHGLVHDSHTVSLPDAKEPGETSDDSGEAYTLNDAVLGHEAVGGETSAPSDLATGRAPEEGFGGEPEPQYGQRDGGPW